MELQEKQMENAEQKTDIKKRGLKDALLDNFNMRRADSGLNRLLVAGSFCFLSTLLFYFGYQLVKMGAKGEFAILSEYKGLKLTLWSLSPGLLFITGGIALLGWALPKTLRAFYDFGNSK
jgi:hypothetical protein